MSLFNPSSVSTEAARHPAKAQHILISCDPLRDHHRRRIKTAVEGWASVSSLPAGATASEVERELTRATIVLGWVSGQLLARSQVQVYLCGSAGLDGYLNVGLEGKAGFRICSAGDIMSVSIAEHILSLMLALVRDLPAIVRAQSQRRWQRRWQGGKLSGSTVCIVGLGASGTELARRCKLLGLRVVGVRRESSHSHPHADAIYAVPDLAEAVGQADHVVALCPGGPHTRHLFNGSIFDKMKPGARFYTAARGSVVDETALISRLENGHLGGAGMDVFAEEPLAPSSPLWGMENVIVSPHSAGLFDHLPDRICEHFCDNLERLHAGRALLNEVDLSRYATPQS